MYKFFKVFKPEKSNVYIDKWICVIIFEKMKNNKKILIKNDIFLHKSWMNNKIILIKMKFFLSINNFITNK